MGDSGEPRNVLLVEGSHAEAERIIQWLQQAAVAAGRLLWVETMAQARRVTSENAFDAVLLDLDLPDSQGEATIAACQDCCPDAAIIALTAPERVGLGAEALQLGAQDELPKAELTPALLRRTVIHARERVRLERERMAAREAQLQAEAPYRTLVEGSSDFIRRSLPDGTMTYANPALAALFDAAPEELEGRCWLAFLHPDLHDWAREYLASFTPGDPIGHFEGAVALPSGEERWIRWTDQALFDETGALTQFQSMGLDITDRKFHEARAHNRETRFRTLIETMVDGVIVIDSAGVIREVNPAAESLFGYPAEAMLGSNVSCLMPEPDRSAHDGYIRHYLETGEERVIGRGREVTGLRRDGTEFPMELAVSEMRTDGEVLFTGIVRDITARKEMEDTLAVEKERLALFRQLFEASEQAIGVTDANGHFVYTNPAHERITGYSAAELAGQHFSGLLPTDEGRDYVAEVLRGLGTEGRWTAQVPLVHKDGRRFVSAANLGVITDDRGETQNLFNLFTDFTAELERQEELSRAKEEAERANRAKSEFLSSMSHELRTPMNAIIGFAQLMEHDDHLDADHADNVREILKAADHLLDLINEVLDLAKVEAGRLTLSLEPVAVDALVAEVLPLVQNMADNYGVTIDTRDLAGRSVQADRTRLKQVVLNLVTNAVKYNTAPGRVVIHAEADDDGGLGIGVTDTGPGIPPERVAEMFEPFNRLDAESGSSEGTGIGLAFSQQVMTVMEGTLRVDSEVGQGSTFWAVLPTAELPAAPTPGEGMPEAIAGPSPAPGTEPQTVLYLEDNPANLKLVSQLLRESPGVELITAENPEVGIELALSRRPNLIFLDINLPGMDGYDVLEILQEDETLRQVPVVALTANAMPKDVERGKRAGFADYLTKPLDVAHFKRVVATYLGEAAASSGAAP